MVLGKVKSGAACPTFKFVCGTTGVGLGCAGVWPDVCGAVDEGADCAAASDAAASKKVILKTLLIIFISPDI